MSKTSRTATADKRRAVARCESLPVAWHAVRGFYPEAIQDAVDDLAERGGLTLRDLSALTTAQLMIDLSMQDAGAENSRQIATHLRLLFRLAMVSGGVSDASTALVELPESLQGDAIELADTGDDLTK